MHFTILVHSNLLHTKFPYKASNGTEILLKYIFSKFDVKDFTITYIYLLIFWQGLMPSSEYHQYSDR